MKSITYSIIAALAAAGSATAETAYTTPVGYNTQSLLQGFNVTGVTLHNTPIASGAFETVNGTTLVDAQVTLTPTAGRLYVLEITTSATPSLVGVISEVPATNISGSTITTTDNLGALGLAANDTYKLRLVPTLEEIFTTTTLASGGVLAAGLNSTAADVVWVPTGTGAYTQYFLHTTGQFRLAGTTTPTPNVPVVYSDAVLVQKKGLAAASLTVTGEVKTVGTTSRVVQGFNPLSTVVPVGLNLWNAGLEDDIQVGLNATAADVVWVQQSNLSYKQYFRHSTGNWRDAAAPTTNLTQTQAEAVDLRTGFLVQRKNASAINIDLNVPSSYTGL
jgi:hypothetical protein